MKHGILSSGNIKQESTGFFRLAKGSTDQRPSSPTEGMIRFNTDLGYIEEYKNQEWTQLGESNLAGRPASGTNSNALTHPGFVNGLFYGSPQVDASQLSNNYFVNGTLYAMPFFIHDGGAFNRIGFNVTHQWQNPNIRIAIYSNVNGAPSALMYDLGQIPINSSGNKEIVFYNSANCYGKWIWVTLLLSSPMNLMCYGWQSSGNPYLGRTSTSSYTNIGVTSTSTPASSFPATFTNPTYVSNIFPYIWIRNT
jgi:hypothetical protein